jgi:hypothetical protein
VEEQQLQNHLLLVFLVLYILYPIVLGIPSKYGLTMEILYNIYMHLELMFRRAKE